MSFYNALTQFICGTIFGVCIANIYWHHYIRGMTRQMHQAITDIMYNAIALAREAGVDIYKPRADCATCDGTGEIFNKHAGSSGGGTDSIVPCPECFGCTLISGD